MCAICKFKEYMKDKEKQENIEFLQKQIANYQPERLSEEDQLSGISG